METNGPANIIMHIRIWIAEGKPINPQFILDEAEKTVKYMRAYDADHDVKWHQITLEEV